MNDDLCSMELHCEELRRWLLIGFLLWVVMFAAVVVMFGGLFVEIAMLQAQRDACEERGDS